VTVRLSVCMFTASALRLLASSSVNTCRPPNTGYAQPATVAAYAPAPSSVVTGNDSVPILQAQCWFPRLATSNPKNINIFFRQNIRKQFYKTALGNCYAVKLTKMQIPVKKSIHCVIYCNFFGTLTFPLK